jgi:hypothetical protein
MQNVENAPSSGLFHPRTGKIRTPFPNEIKALKSRSRFLSTLPELFRVRFPCPPRIKTLQSYQIGILPTETSCSDSGLVIKLFELKEKKKWSPNPGFPGRLPDLGQEQCGPSPPKSSVFPFL